ncbi:MAG TPA: hypothetical protein VGM05_27290 [Planctomycetaceae bacterium]
MIPPLRFSPLSRNDRRYCPKNLRAARNRETNSTWRHHQPGAKNYQRGGRKREEAIKRGERDSSANQANSEPATDVAGKALMTPDSLTDISKGAVGGASGC